MRRTTILLLIVIVLAGIYYFTSKKTEEKINTVNIEDREFVVDSEDNISIFTIKNPGYPLMHFARQEDGSWMLNNKYKADPYIVKNMTGVLKNMKIKYLPPKTMTDKILSDLEQIGIEIKAYDANGKILSDFIMGANDNKELTTYCVKRGAKQPYAMYVSVAEGGLRNYFNQTQRDLRDKTVFKVKPAEIEQLSINYHKDKRNSFEIQKDQSGYKLEAMEKFNAGNGSANSNTVRSYLLGYDKLIAEAIRTGEIKTDSIKNLIPFATLSYTLNDNTKAEFEFYPMKDLFVEEVNTQTVSDLKEIERYFLFDHRGDVFIVQQRMVDHIFKPLDYFMR